MPDKPNSIRLVSQTSHWGAFSVEVDGARALGVRPHPDDPDPSPLLGNVVPTLVHASRVRRPAVRRGWLEDGPGPTAARGQDEFVELNWSDALDLVAREVDRVTSEHGNEAIFGGSYGWASAGIFHHAPSQLHRFLNSIGGCTRSVNSYSLGTSLVLLPHIAGSADEVLRRATSWQQVAQHAELLVAFGGIPEKNVRVIPGGVTRHTSRLQFEHALERGLEVELITPLRADGPPSERVHWWPIVPGTDVAMMLALAHTLVVEHLADLEFVERYCAGYESFARYLLGSEDGQPKDAAWAEPICGFAAEEIRRLARTMSARRTLVNVTWSLQRIEHGEQPVWAGLALAALLGQIGLPGVGFGHGYGSMGDVGATGPLMRLPSMRAGTNPVRAFIPVARVADMLLGPGEQFRYNGASYVYPTIRLVYWAGGNPFHHHQDLNRLRRAFGRPDTIIVHEPYWTPMARHADIVLPSTVTLERDDIGGGRRDTHLIAMQRAVPPFGESRDDYAIFAGLAERLGSFEKFSEGRSVPEWLEHLYESWRAAVTPDGVVVPPFDEFWEQGGIELPVPEDDTTLFSAFREDPDAHPLATSSGKLELASSAIESFGEADCPGHPTWIEPSEWLGGERATRFPLHLVANQPTSRLHSQLDMGPVSQATKVHDREPIRLHPDDAAERGIGAGDVVRVFNDRGACLAGAVPTTDIRRGVVRLSTGAWYNPLEIGGEVTCIHGNPNVLTPDIGTSHLAQGCSGQHCLVEVERFDGQVPDITAFDPPQFVKTRAISERRPPGLVEVSAEAQRAVPSRR